MLHSPLNSTKKINYSILNYFTNLLQYVAAAPFQVFTKRITPNCRALVLLLMNYEQLYKKNVSTCVVDACSLFLLLLLLLCTVVVSRVVFILKLVKLRVDCF